MSGPSGLGVPIFPDGSTAVIVPAGRALSWQTLGSLDVGAAAARSGGPSPVVRERYWLTFQPGEVRTCAGCHGINHRDQMGDPAPTNPPQALGNL